MGATKCIGHGHGVASAQDHVVPARGAPHGPRNLMAGEQCPCQLPWGFAVAINAARAPWADSSTLAVGEFGRLSGHMK